MTYGQLYCSFSFFDNNKHTRESLGKRIWHIRFIIALERENKTKLYNIKKEKEKKISVITFLLQMIDSF
jgi:hypothetical protein